MPNNWSRIRLDTLALVLSTDIGQRAIAEAEARGMAKAEARGELNARRRIYLKLSETMPEAEARRITGYTGD
jgi:hypothetical protein